MLIVPALVAFLFLFHVFVYPFLHYVPNINGDFQKALADCDKIIIRDGGYDPNLRGYSNKTLKLIDDPCGVRDFINAIHFSHFQRKGACACYGWPAIDFYNGDRIIMITSVKHNIALSTPIKGYDIGFTHDTKIFFEGLSSGLTMEETAADANTPVEGEEQNRT